MAAVQPTSPQLQPKELSFPLSKVLHTTAHVHLTVLETCVMVFVTVTTPGEGTGSTKPMGSFVYAMPDVSFLRVSSPFFISFFSFENPSNQIR